MKEAHFNQMTKINITSKAKWTSCASRYETLRKSHHLCSIPASCALLESNHEKTLDKPSRRTLYKITGPYSLKIMNEVKIMMKDQKKKGNLGTVPD